MIITYLRSSSYNDFSYCAHKYFLKYVLGLPDPGNKAADTGNIVHKAMELLALRKVAEQKGEAAVTDEAFEGVAIATKSIDPEFALNSAWKHCTTAFSHHDWTQADFKDCSKMIREAMEFNNGAFNPLKLNIEAVEKKFDLEVIKPWSKYHFKTPNGPLEGYLGLKGTVDLIVRQDNSTIEVVDWKTGRYRKDISTGEEKTIEKFENDPQLRLYHYAMCQLYPDVDNIFITVFYIRAGGPFSIFFTRRDLEKTEEMLRERFQKIKDTVRPRLIYPDWKCTKLCHFGKNNQPGLNKTICMHYRDEIVKLGLEKVTNKYANFKSLTEYGAGGGKY